MLTLIFALSVAPTVCRRLRSITMAAAAGVFLAAPPSARATAIAYVFAPGASTVLGGDTEMISGSFTFDTTTFTELAVTISLAGAAPYAGTYTNGTYITGALDTIEAFSQFPDAYDIFHDRPSGVNLTLDTGTAAHRDCFAALAMTL